MGLAMAEIFPVFLRGEIIFLVFRRERERERKRGCFSLQVVERKIVSFWLKIQLKIVI